MADALRMLHQHWESSSRPTTTEPESQDHPHNTSMLSEANVNASALNLSAVDPAPEDRPMSLPDEADLVLLCCDYLRDLRRAYAPTALHETEGIHGDYLTLACWALTRALTAPAVNVTTEPEGNDAWFDVARQHAQVDADALATRPVLHTSKANQLPSLQDMEDEILYRGNVIHMDASAVEVAHSPVAGQSTTKEDPQVFHHSYDWYDYDDAHPSNRHRFYPLQGLASGPDLPGSLTLGEMVAAGLVGLQAKTRRQAEESFTGGDHVRFEQYINALSDRGFFDIETHDETTGQLLTEEERDAIYQERYAKVVAKFRIKLASNIVEAHGGDPSLASSEGFLAALTAAEQQRQRREVRRHYALQAAAEAYENEDEMYHDREEKSDDAASNVGSHVGTEVSAASYVKRMAFAARLFPTVSPSAMLPNKPPSKEQASKKPTHKNLTLSASASSTNPADLEEAEKLKNQGNAHMQHKEYEQAAQCYTQALQLSPAGPQSHVYFSNRAAALVSLRQFEKAILDSERSLSLQPSYAKAHARLGLAHFLLGQYQQAKDAYEVALEYEPNNKSNQSYLEKSTKRLAEQEQQEGGRTSRKASHESVRSSSSSSILKEAEKFKTKGNGLMANREYEKALDAYTHAIQCSSQGPQSHVYYSNRAAALCYLERYQEAELDSLKSLDLDPTYGKAHARLGLSRFFLHDYAGAVDAYTQALEYDPDNAASQSYLAKAQAKLAKHQARGKSTERHSSKASSPSKPKPTSSTTATMTKTPPPVSTTSPSSSSHKAKSPEEMDITSRKLLYDENLRTMATKAMSNPSTDLLNDPEMHAKAKKAMAAMRKSGA